MFTFVVCFLSTIGAGALAEYLPVDEYLQHPYEVEYAHAYDNYEPSDYHFQYAVSDPHTGDHKSQWEVKEKGVVRGMYSLLEPDGTTRVVEYIADDHGFRATVKKLGTPVETHQHHGGDDVLLHLPEAYTNGYSGAYSGLGQNYGTHNYVAPIEVNNQHHATPVELNGQHYVAPIELNNQHYVAPIELNNQHYVAPIELNNQHYVAPGELNNHHAASVEVHGFTGNSDDDSSYTNYDDDNHNDNKAALYYQTNNEDDNQHGYYTAHPAIIPVPYKLAYQFEKPYAYTGHGYDGY